MARPDPARAIRALVEPALGTGWALRSVTVRGRAVALVLDCPHAPLTLRIAPRPASGALVEGRELAILAEGWSPRDSAVPREARRVALLVCKALLEAEDQLAGIDARPPVSRRSRAWALPVLGLFGLASLGPVERLPILGWAVLVGLAYLAVAAWVGERFPFSRFAAYARTAQRAEGAALSVRVDGQEARITDFVGFTGFDLGELRRLAARSSQSWELVECERWLVDHAGVAPGPVAVEILVHRYTSGEGGFEAETVVAARGAARRRT